MSQHILLRHREIPDIHKLPVYRQQDGFQAFHKVVTSMQPDEVIEAVTKSGLRGRGGGGFPTGRKWKTCRDAAGDAKYVLCNAD
ncbi:MAG: NADH-quinone oxidoreductase subunit F, partial [Anaerolineales bacterium]